MRSVDEDPNFSPETSDPGARRARRRGGVILTSTTVLAIGLSLLGNLRADHHQQSSSGSDVPNGQITGQKQDFPPPPHIPHIKP